MNTKELTQRVSAVLIKLRINHPGRLTQKNIEDAADLVCGSYHDLEAGKCRFKIEDLFKIAKFYNKRPSQLVAMIEQSSEDLSKEKQLQLTIDQLLVENERLKGRIAEMKGVMA